jgi:hypothetical protein
MSRFTDGGPVHPGTEANGLNSGWPGMTLRDYFAAKTLPDAIKHWTQVDEDDEGGGDFVWDTSRVSDDCLAAAELAYRMADAMLKARQA